MAGEHTTRAVFMGTPAFALPVLGALLDRGAQVVGVFTQPDRPSGRGKQVNAPPAKRLAVERGLPVFQPDSLRGRQVQEELASLAPDVVVVAAYGLLLPARVLETPPLGCLNVHPSLLPRYRGPSPVAAAILNGDQSTGVTIMKLDSGMDTGPIIASRECPIGERDTAEDLTARLFEKGAELLVEVLPRWARGEVRATPQDDDLATLTSRLKKADGEIDWGHEAEQIARQVRAYRPWPGSHTRWRGKVLKVLEATTSPIEGRPASAPGVAVEATGGGLGITTARGVLVVRRLQLEGRREAEASEFLRGNAEVVGSALG